MQIARNRNEKNLNLVFPPKRPLRKFVANIVASKTMITRTIAKTVELQPLIQLLRSVKMLPRRAAAIFSSVTYAL